MKMSIANSIYVKITNIETNIVKIFRGNLEAAKYLNIGISTLRTK